MTRLQYAVLASALLLFCALYFVFDTKPPEQAKLEKSRVLRVDEANINIFLQEARASLDGNNAAQINQLEQSLADVLQDTARIRLLQELSGSWFSAGHPLLAGHYAEELAKLDGQEESWSIAGTTFSICAQRMTDQEKKDFCSNHAITAFESAISLNPDEVSNRVNLALTYTTNPPRDNPMKGVLLLRELQETYPDNTMVLNSLGRLAIQTGQYAKAVERLGQALVLEADNVNTICLLSRAYEGQGDIAAAQTYADRCQELRSQ